MRVTSKYDPTATHYIGRNASSRRLVHAHLGNPFWMQSSSDQERERVIREYEAWARNSKAVMDRIRALPEDAVLGCYCAPKACHGDVIIRIWKEMHS